MAKNNRFSINCRGKLLDISSPLVMGILNSTPDSFYSQGREQHWSDLLGLAETMVNDGADILDLGGMSTRPGATLISEEEEMKRVLPALEKILERFPNMMLSIDTFRASVAKEALQMGASIINDVSGGELDPAMFSVVASYKAPYICMHMQGTPQTMQQQPRYEDVVTELFAYFQRKVYLLREAGIMDVILDPGFGFGKTMQHNYALMANLDVFTALQAPLLIGVSRKKMVQQPLGIGANDALNGSTALHMMALMKGASILRVHDVKEAKQCVTLFNTAKNSEA